MATSNPSLEEIAFHEAGHAVVHHENGVRFLKISIEPDTDGKSLGHVSLKLPKWYRTEASPTRARLYMERLVIGQMAGHIAQEKHAQKSPDFETYESDLEQALEHVCRFVGSMRTAEAYMRLLWEMARDLVEMESTWRQIEALAAALLQRKAIGYRDASKLIREAKWK